MDQEGQSINLAGKRIAISVPCYKGVVPMDWVVAFTQTQHALQEHGSNSYLQCRMNSGLIHAVRNELVHTALQDPLTTHILFLDDDIIWKPDDVLRLLALCETGHDFICAAYPARSDTPHYFVEFAKSDKGELIQNKSGMVMANGVPSGFMLLKREVFENESLKAQCNFTKPNRGDLKDQLICGYFDHIHEGLTGMGEDIAFCLRYRRAGGTIWVDPMIDLAHVGVKSYRGNLVEWLKSQQPPSGATNEGDLQLRANN